MPIGNINCITKSSDEPYEGKLQVRFLVAGDGDGIVITAPFFDPTRA
jgi:hypothetical protein